LPRKGESKVMSGKKKKHEMPGTEKTATGKKGETEVLGSMPMTKKKSTFKKKGWEKKKKLHCEEKKKEKGNWHGHWGQGERRNLVDRRGKK